MAPSVHASCSRHIELRNGHSLVAKQHGTRRQGTEVVCLVNERRVTNQGSRPGLLELQELECALRGNVTFGGEGTDDIEVGCGRDAGLAHRQRHSGIIRSAVLRLVPVFPGEVNVSRHAATQPMKLPKRKGRPGILAESDALLPPCCGLRRIGIYTPSTEVHIAKVSARLIIAQLGGSPEIAKGR